MKSQFWLLDFSCDNNNNNNNHHHNNDIERHTHDAVFIQITKCHTQITKNLRSTAVVIQAWYVLLTAVTFWEAVHK